MGWVGGCLKIEVMRISLLLPSMEVAGGWGGGMVSLKLGSPRIQSFIEGQI